LAFNIADHNNGLHHRGGSIGAYVHVNMSDQFAMIKLVKVACSKATTILCFELFLKFLDAEIMLAFGIVYMQYWLCEENATKNFFPHLDKIKAAFCVGKKIKGGVVVVGLLDSQQPDVQAFYFKLTMNHNVEAVMQEPLNVNPITLMWLKIQFFPLLVLKLSEYIKVVEIVTVQSWVQLKMKGLSTIQLS
jgi:hypothetical protein